MKKPWQKNLETVLGVLVGNIVLAFTVAAFMVPHGIIMGGAQPLSPGSAFFDHFDRECVSVPSGSCDIRKEVCNYDDSEHISLSGVPVGDAGDTGGCGAYG